MRDSEEARKDRRARFIEVLISVAASIFSSAVVVSWTLSASLTRLETRLNDHDREFVGVRSQIDGVTQRDITQGQQMAANEARYSDILRRLESIDRKLETRP